jgi:MFS transporter, AAHS family, 4-hydroxybenzoate transporter
MTPTPTLATAEIAPNARWSITLLAFVTILLDGFDTTSIGFVVPTLAREWALPPAAFTAAFVATSLGAVIGYTASGTASARYGRRAVVLWAVAAFALGSCSTALVASIAQLSLLRLFTGIGLGAALPACISLAVEHGPGSRREAITVGVAAGLALGATIGGATGGRLISQFGWPSVFWVGGVLPALLLPLLWRGLPADACRAAPTPPGEVNPAGVSGLLEGSLRWPTVLLWTFSFLIFTATYAMSFWTPTLLLAFGFGPADVPAGAAAMGAGGVLAALLLVPLTAWCGVRPVLTVSTGLAVVAIVALARLAVAPAAVLFAVGALGACLIAGTLGQAAIAVSLYGARARTTGVGWSAALGRVGSIVGPAFGGFLLSIGHAPRDVLLTLCVPTALGVVVLVALARSSR